MSNTDTQNVNENETIEERTEDTTETGATETGGNGVEINPNAKEAIELAKIAANDDWFNSRIEAFDTARKEVKLGPAGTLLALQELYGDQLDNFPVPNMKPDDPELRNRKPAKYSYQATGARNKPVTKWGDWYDDFVYGLPKGKALHDEIATLEKKEVEHVKLMNPQDYELALNNAKQRLRNYRAVVKRAMEIYHQTAWIVQIPDVEVLLPTKTVTVNGKTHELPVDPYEPFVVQHPTDRKKWQTYSVDAFLALDYKKTMDRATAANRPMSYDDLIVSATRGTKKKGQASGGTGAQATGADKAKEKHIPVLETVEMAEEALAEFAAYVTDGRKFSKLLDRLAKAKGDDRKHLVLTIGDACDALDSLWTKIKDEYTGYKESAAVKGQAA